MDLKISSKHSCRSSYHIALLRRDRAIRIPMGQGSIRAIRRIIRFASVHLRAKHHRTLPTSHHRYFRDGDDFLGYLHFLDILLNPIPVLSLNLVRSIPCT